MLDDLFEPLIHVMIRVQELEDLVDFEAAHWQHAGVMIPDQRPLADLPQVMVGLDDLGAGLALVLRLEPLTRLSQLLKRRGRLLARRIIQIHRVLVRDDVWLLVYLLERRRLLCGLLNVSELGIIPLELIG